MSTYLIWILEVQVDSIEQPIKSNSEGAGHMSHRRTSALNDHVDHSFVLSSKMYNWAFALRRVCVCGDFTTDQHFGHLLSTTWY